MINVKIFQLKSILKYFILFLILITSFFLLFNFKNINLGNYIFSNTTLFISWIDNSLPIIKSINPSFADYSKNTSGNILCSELPIIKVSSSVATDIPSTFDDLDEDIYDTLEYSSDDTTTEIIPSDIPNTYTNDYNGVEIKNNTDFELSEEILNPNDLSINNSDIIIFHTHTCESYTQSNLYQYEASGNFRTTDLNRSVCYVGDTLTDYLKSYNYNVLHDTTYHDYPSYSGSYGRSLSTVNNLLISKPNTDVIIDLHRDAIGDSTYAPSVKIGNEIVSQLMFVMGSNGSGLEHPNWQNNLKFAVKVQQKANELYPGLFRPIILRNSRYNQHLGKAACIIEVGATGNTLDQSIGSMKYLSKVLNEVLKKDE